MSADSFGTESVVIPDLPEPITAYRAWTWNGKTLRGYADVKWPRDTHLTGEHQGGGWSGMWSSVVFAGTSDSSNTPCVECPSPDGTNHQGHGCGMATVGPSALEILAGSLLAALALWGVGALARLWYRRPPNWRHSDGMIALTVWSLATFVALVTLGSVIG